MVSTVKDTEYWQQHKAGQHKIKVYLFSLIENVFTVIKLDSRPCGVDTDSSTSGKRQLTQKGQFVLASSNKLDKQIIISFLMCSGNCQNVLYEL